MEKIITKIFPNYYEVPVNSITSAIFGEDQEKVIYLLIVGNKSLVQPFLDDTKDEAKIKTVLTAEKGYNKILYDLILDFYFYFKRGKGSFRVVFEANHPELQKQYVEALKQIESLRFIIADEERKLRKTFDVDWYYYKNKRVISKVEKAWN